MNRAVIKEYKDLEGVKQITLNSLNARGPLRIYERVYASLNEMFSPEEATKLRQTFTKNKVHVFELTNQAYKEKIEEPVGFENYTEVRYLDPKLVRYDTEIIIYDDVVAFYEYGDKPYGVEIRDKAFAETQKAIFDVLWRKASRPVIGRGGRSSLI